MSASRLKGKPLLEINGLPIICHVLNKAKYTGIDTVVATEDKEIVKVVESNVGKAVLTGKHETGNARINEALIKIEKKEINYIIN